jgi:hypothetical protein
MEVPHPAPPTSQDDIARKDGLPAISPDVVEQEQGEEFDDIVPSKAYDMLPVVGLGGSAGSIQALRQFFEVMPEESGMAFVVVLHLAPENASIMDDILGRTTQMPVVQAVDGQKLEANHVYVIPPGKLLSAQNGRLCLTPIEAERGKRIVPERRGWRRRARDRADQETRWTHRGSLAMLLLEVAGRLDEPRAIQVSRRTSRRR